MLTELEELYSDGQEVSFHALRQIPKLDNVVKETLRLHPPLIILMRVAKGEFEVAGFPIHDGDYVAASPAISNRIPEDFPDPDAFKPDRYNKPEQADIVNRWTWIPFGAGRHRCVGAAFAQMQIKAIFSVLLREYEFEMAQPADSYHNDHSKMVVQLARPAKARYRRRNGRLDHGIPGRSRLGLVPRPCHVRAGGARLLPGAQTRQGRDPRPRTARGGPRRSRAGRRNVPHPSTIHQRERETDSKCQPSHSREKLEAWVDRWLQANKDCEKAGDWRPLGDFYAPEATYGWNIGPKEDVMCVGVDEIRDVALGLEMEGLENWVYEYQKVLIDDKQGEIVGFWKQIVNKTDGSQDEIYGIGGSWFRLNDDATHRMAARLLRLRARREDVREPDRIRRPQRRDAEPHRAQRGR